MKINVPSSNKEPRSKHILPMLACLKKSGGRKGFVQNKNFTESEIMDLCEQVGNSREIYFGTGRGKSLELPSLNSFSCYYIF